ncbi:hypothetical protein D623_10035314 [Myotis brandtii]|uniref:Secreted protein n=1 Tax=Myotis brandtii TaxID=109478 RepID=S7P5G3_MYOBR|nr:hypothetical protein D623_10035314 [Myotis brandtii]
MQCWELEDLALCLGLTLPAILPCIPPVQAVMWHITANHAITAKEMRTQCEFSCLSSGNIYPRPVQPYIRYRSICCMSAKITGRWIWVDLFGSILPCCQAHKFLNAADSNLDSGKERERHTERNINVRKTHQLVASACTPTRARDQAGNQDTPERKKGKHGFPFRFQDFRSHFFSSVSPFRFHVYNACQLTSGRAGDGVTDTQGTTSTQHN